jgi:hypothetical protein
MFMKKSCFSFLVCLSILLTEAKTQILSTSNKPSQTYSRSRRTIATDASVYGVFVGRTPCQEFIKELDMEIREACAKRKMGLILYYDSVTHKPTVYETRGMGKWTGKGKWYIIYGMPGDPGAIIFKLDLDAHTFLFLLKGDDNVLFILDKNKNFLVGNGHHSYTFNRARN